MVLLRIDGEKWEARDNLRIHVRKNYCWKIFKKVTNDWAEQSSLFSKAVHSCSWNLFIVQFVHIFGRMWISVDDWKQSSCKLHCISIVFKGKPLIIVFWDCQKINEHLTTLIKVGAIITALQMFCIYLVFHVCIWINFKNSCDFGVKHWNIKVFGSSPLYIQVINSHLLI